jgi:5'-3' exonuclease
MLAIVDADVLAYQACKSRWQSKVQIKNNVALIQLDSEGKRVPLEFTKEEDRRYLEESWINFKSDLAELLDKVYCKEHLSAVKGENNFRNLLFPNYKINRHKDPNKQNMFVPTLRKLAVAEGLAVEANGREADDLLRIWAEEARAAGQDYIICSIDKDLKCIPGKHYYMKTGEEKVFEMSEEAALKFYYTQLLKGDPTDNILGVPNIGEIKSARLLASLNTEEEYQECVVEQYLLAYGPEWEEQLLLNGRLIYLQKHRYDYFDMSSWPVVQALRSSGGV